MNEWLLATEGQHPEPQQQPSWDKTEGEGKGKGKGKGELAGVVMVVKVVGVAGVVDKVIFSTPRAADVVSSTSIAQPA
ncbi:hypothetical protein FRC06_008787, partial [Ceratobasidium sp. 370]